MSKKKEPEDFAPHAEQVKEWSRRNELQGEEREVMTPDERAQAKSAVGQAMDLVPLTRSKVFTCAPSALAELMDAWLAEAKPVVTSVQIAQSEHKTQTGTPATILTCLVLYVERVV